MEKMFTIGAIAVIVIIGWYVERLNVADRQRTEILSDDEVRTAILHARQDLKLIAFLLTGILVMLGVIADKVS
jgi:hypothetical protein